MTPRVREILSSLYRERKITALRAQARDLTDDEWDFLEATFHFQRTRTPHEKYREKLAKAKARYRELRNDDWSVALATQAIADEFELTPPAAQRRSGSISWSRAN